MYFPRKLVIKQIRVELHSNTQKTTPHPQLISTGYYADPN